MNMGNTRAKTDKKDNYFFLKFHIVTPHPSKANKICVKKYQFVSNLVHLVVKVFIVWDYWNEKNEIELEGLNWPKKEAEEKIKWSLTLRDILAGSPICQPYKNGHEMGMIYTHF
jgi:hypothetical protein